MKFFILLFALTILTNIYAEEDKIPVTDVELSQIMNEDNLVLKGMVTKVYYQNKDGCEVSNTPFGETQVCSSKEKNSLYVKRNNVIIYRQDLEMVLPEPTKKEDIKI